MELDGKKIALETNDYDFGLSTQDMENLSQDTFSKSKNQGNQDKERRPHLTYVMSRYIEPEKHHRMPHWCTSVKRIGKKPLHIGPAKLDSEMAARLITKTECLANS
ncbi:unnamed protein product, partial [Eruca vesicaria subsp. sativa]|nr:unnamed protein product [Eruca vesicaria subsp. sativa]